jgi:glycerol-3-phosphate dehydrogenase
VLDCGYQCVCSVLFRSWTSLRLALRTEASDHPQPPEADIEWLVNEARRYLNPEIKLERKHVLSSWTGVRPLARDPNVSAEEGDTPNTAAASRDHIISYNPETGTVFAAGGKWTTYREMLVTDSLFFLPSHLRICIVYQCGRRY